MKVKGELSLYHKNAKVQLEKKPVPINKTRGNTVLNAILFMVYIPDRLVLVLPKIPITGYLSNRSTP